MQGDLARSRAGGGQAARPGRRTRLTDIAQGYRRSCDLPRRCGRGCVPPCAAAREPEPDRAAGPRASPRSGAAISRQALRSCRTPPPPTPPARSCAPISARPTSPDATEAGGSEAVRHREGAGSRRPHALVLRRDPPPARQPAGCGAALDRPVDRAQRQPRAVPLAAAARSGPGHARRQSRPDLPGPWLHPARHQRGRRALMLDPGSSSRAPFPVRRLSGRAAGSRRPGSASCCSRSSCSRSGSTRSSRAWASPIST